MISKNCDKNRDVRYAASNNVTFLRKVSLELANENLEFDNKISMFDT